MHLCRRSWFALRAAPAVGFGLVLLCANAWGADGIVSVQSRTVTTRFTAYAEVTPIAVAKLRAAQAGVVDGLNVVPGQSVGSGAILGKLQGPEIEARMAQRRAAVTSAQSALHAAQQALAIERQKRNSHLSTRQAVFAARASVSQARANLSTARAALRAAKNTAVLRTPDAGTVISLTVANGERVEAGQNLLILQPAHHLWLKAVYYGTDADTVHVGMRGRFSPADGSAPIAVEVASVVPAVQPDGGQPIGLRPTQKNADWRSGEAGTVTLEGARHTAVAVPTRALILDRGRWWVLVHTPHGNRRRTVTPGPSRGDDTVIEHGLPAGTEVVVTNAYLKFHRDFSQHYQPPD